MGIAFKFNYCNGRENIKGFGFKGLCSQEFIKMNIEKKKASWCSHYECSCTEWYKGKVTYEELEEIYEKSGICNESRLLIDWTAYAEYDNKNGSWRARAIRQAEIGDLCLLTAIRPNMKEKDRKIFGVFLIGDVYEGDDENCGYVEADSKYRVELNIAETNNYEFWDYYKNTNRPKETRWGQGAFRYITNEEGAQILKKLVEIKRGTKEIELVEEMLIKYCENKGINIDEISEPKGANKIF